MTRPAERARPPGLARPRTRGPRSDATSRGASSWTRHLPVALVLLAVPFLRPNLWGEAFSLLGLLLLVAAAVVVTILRSRAGAVPRWATVRTTFDPVTVLVALVSLAYLYVLGRQAVFASAEDTQDTLQGIVLTCGGLAALLVVLGEPRTRAALARAFVVLMVVLCASYAVTVVIWAVAGVGSAQIGTVPIGTWGPQPLFFPLTFTEGFQNVFGVQFPRFSGIGREPGWMAMYCAVAFFMADRVGIRSRTAKGALLAGLIGTVSTAGFGVFVVVWAYERFLRDRGGITMTNYLRQLFGLAAIGAAGWVAVYAPVLGLSAKSTQNATSLDQRRTATLSGVRALTDDPWGGPTPVVQGGINLISDIAVSGLPFVALVVLGLLVATSRIGSGRAGTAVVLVVLFTLLLSQPAKDSTWAFGVVVLAGALYRPDTPDPPGRTPAGRPRSGHVRRQLRVQDHPTPVTDRTSEEPT